MRAHEANGIVDSSLALTPDRRMLTFFRQPVGYSTYCHHLSNEQRVLKARKLPRIVRYFSKSTLIESRTMIFEIVAQIML
jgi:hypothetical protein